MTNAQRERLIKLMEECAEVIQICSKTILYGYEEMGPIHKSEGLSNRERLENELLDVIFWIGMLTDADDIDENNIMDISKLEAKHKKILKYTRYQEGSQWSG